MARLQDFQTVTPTSSDKLHVVQSQGQCLVPYGSKLDSANPTGTGTLTMTGSGLFSGDLTIMGNKSVNDAITVATPTNITLTLQSGINLSIESMTVKRISKLNIINLTLLTSATLNASTEIFVGVFSNILTGYGYVCGSMVTANDTKEQGAFNVNTANGRLFICPTNSIPSGYKLSMSIYLLSA